MIVAIFRACMRQLSADSDEKITRTPLFQHTNTDNSRPANNTNTATSPADDALVESLDTISGSIPPHTSKHGGQGSFVY